MLERLARWRADEPDKLPAWIERQRRTFLEKLLPKDADGQVISVARRFATIAAAGGLARSFGVLPWEPNEALNAAAAAFKAWLAARGGIGAAEDVQAIRTVRRFIEQHGESRFTLVGPGMAQSDEDEVRSARPTLNRVGFRRENADGGEFLFLPETWQAEVCKGLDPARAAAALYAAGFLEKGDGKNWAKKQRVPKLWTRPLLHRFRQNPPRRCR